MRDTLPSLIGQHQPIARCCQDALREQHGNQPVYDGDEFWRTKRGRGGEARGRIRSRYASVPNNLPQADEEEATRAVSFSRSESGRELAENVRFVTDDDSIERVKECDSRDVARVKPQDLVPRLVEMSVTPHQLDAITRNSGARKDQKADKPFVEIARIGVGRGQIDVLLDEFFHLIPETAKVDVFKDR
jgi:hypothetical protein